MRAKLKFVPTHLEKIFWPQEKYTKGDVIDYYQAIAKTILPYLKDRPMVLNRHPNGIEAQSFFQKQLAKNQIPSWIETSPVKHSNRTINYIIIQDINSLLYVVNLGCIELNPFHARITSLDYPDYMVIDLDPEHVIFDRVVELALCIHEILDELQMPNYCKTSGGRGLHIYIPLGAHYDFQQSQDLAKMIALLAQSKLPKLVSLAHKPDQRQGQIYIDYLRNISHQTLAAPYCLRPKAHAPVSTPLLWSEVKAGLNPLDFTLKTVPERVKILGDVFKPVLGKGIKLEKSLKALQKLDFYDLNK